MDETQEFTPRPYQIDLYERAAKENTIIYLPTGSGKTFIAVLLIKKYSSKVQMPFQEGGKRIVFIVNTVPLVAQQTNYIARHTGLICRGYSGEMGVDYWNKMEWEKEICEVQVLVMVSEIFHSLLLSGHMQLSDVCLLIFDECHKGVGNHPMRSIMKCFERYKVEDHPRVLGLTATLLNCNMNVDKVESTVRELEVTFQSRVATVDSALTVQEYGNLAESFQEYDPPKTYDITEKLNELMDYMLQVLDTVHLPDFFDSNPTSKELAPKSKNAKVKQFIVDIREHIDSMGLYGGSKTILVHMVQIECIKKYNVDHTSLIVLDFLLSQMTKMRKLIADKMEEHSELDQLYKFSSDQILMCFEVLRHINETKTESQKFCTIIFVRRRTTAITLYHILKNLSKHDERYKFLRPEYIIGYTNNPYKNPRESLCLAKWNREALLRFRNGTANCVVATDVVDEGVDIPSCTLILRYDLPMDFRGYIQSKGRARDKAGKYVMLLSRRDHTYQSRHANFKRVEGFLKQALIGFSRGREEVSHEEIDQGLYQHDLKPYIVVNQHGVESIITSITAISMINRYAMGLASSKFVRLSPIWKLHKISDGNVMKYKVSLQMPRQSLLKEVVDGDVMDSIPLAKQSAALNACRRLHEIGELTDDLQPVSIKNVLQNVDFLFPNWENEKIDGAPGERLPGTTSKKRVHSIEYATSFYGAFPVPGVTLYLHVIEAKPSYSRPGENRQAVFHEMLSDDAGFAFLTTKEMPDLPNFPIYMNVGELNVNIKPNHSLLNLSAREIFELRIFQWVIFHDVLKIVKSFMAFDTANLGNSFLIVPTNKDHTINWDVVGKYKSLEEIPPCDTVDPNDYEKALIMPDYRAASNVYVVTQVCDDLFVESSFPTTDYYSYFQYFKERHSRTIKDPKQPMLEVKSISSKINCIIPRGVNSGLSKRKRDILLEDFEEHLVGELCQRISFPALYWLKATYLPSVIHRVSQLLVAEDLRVKIYKETNLGVLKLSAGDKWPKIVIKQTEAAEAPDSQLDNSGYIAEETIAAVQPVDVPGPEIEILGLPSKLYPWSKDQEPTNLYHEMEQIQLIDIEYYHQFMQNKMSPNDDILKKQCRSHEFASRMSLTAPALSILDDVNPRGPSPADVMQALTSKTAHDAFNLERLETLGDSFLKYAATLYLYEAFPKYNEGHLTTIKGRTIGNRNLYYCGKAKNIPGRMKLDDFVPNSNFIPPAFSVLRPIQELLRENEISPNVLYEIFMPANEQLSGCPSQLTIAMMEEKVLAWNETNPQSGMQQFLDQQTVPDKTVSDCVEALIGVYLISLGLVGAFKILTWFGILPETLKIQEILTGTPPNPRLGIGDPDFHIVNADYIEKRIRYVFQDRAYLLQALTHPSYTPNCITESYERLEFLGDALLDFLITVHIYQTCDNLNPGALTDLRSSLVNNITFACLAVKYGLHTGLLNYVPYLQDSIERFVKFQEERDHKVDDELLYILLEEEECKISEYIDVPKILGDIFESVIGAIYLDSGKNLKVVWEIVYGLMHNEITEFSKNVPKQPIRVLLETPGAMPKYSEPTIVKSSEGSAVFVCLEVFISGKLKTFHGFGANNKQARCAASKQALKFLRNSG